MYDNRTHLNVPVFQQGSCRPACAWCVLLGAQFPVAAVIAEVRFLTDDKHTIRTRLVPQLSLVFSLQLQGTQRTNKPWEWKLHLSYKVKTITKNNTTKKNNNTHLNNTENINWERSQRGKCQIPYRAASRISETFFISLLLPDLIDRSSHFSWITLTSKE